jgi:hypothetical protein
VIVAPLARATTYGSPPTALNARIDEFTPPGIARFERSNISVFDGTPAPTQTVGVQPAAAQRVASQGEMRVSAMLLLSGVLSVPSTD